jgi:hypothetical protein
MENINEFVTIIEMAALCRVSERTVGHWIGGGRFPTVVLVVGRQKRRLIPRAAAERFANGYRRRRRPLVPPPIDREWVLAHKSA